MRLSFAALAALLVASAVPETALYAQAPPGQPYIQVPIPQIPGVTPQPRGDHLRSGALGALRAPQRQGT